MEGLEMCLLDAIYSLLNSFTRLIALLSTRSTSVPRVTSCVRTVQRGRR